MLRLFIALSLLAPLCGLVACQSSDDDTASSSAELSKHAQLKVLYTGSIMSESASDRASAVRWFGDFVAEDPAIRQRLRDLLADDPEVTVRRVAAAALGSPGYEDACDDLRRAIRRDDDYHVRLEAIRSLGKHRDPSDMQLWQEMLDDPDTPEQVQGVVLAALAHLDTRDAGRAICDRLARSGNVTARVDHHCLDALATMSPDAALDEFLRTMERKRFTVSTINAMRLREEHGQATMSRLVQIYRRCERSRASGVVLPGDAFVGM